MIDPDYSAELEWVQRTQRGDKEAFSLLVKRYMKQAYYVALGFVGSHDDALDLSQDAFVRAYRAMPGFDPTMRFYTWYYRILKNLCLNFLRDRKNRPSSILEILDHETASQQESGDMKPGEALEQSEQRRQVWDALWALRVEDRELIVARDMLGTSYKKLAELMDCPMGTVMSRLYHARRRLRIAFERLES
jgi:RNA polymerase sigma-70 factor (ECF subfamily)